MDSVTSIVRKMIEKEGGTNIEISSQPKKHYLEIKEHEIVKNENLYNLNLILEADTKISVTFAKIKATVT